MRFSWVCSLSFPAAPSAPFRFCLAQRQPACRKSKHSHNRNGCSETQPVAGLAGKRGQLDFCSKGLILVSMFPILCSYWISDKLRANLSFELWPKMIQSLHINKHSNYKAVSKLQTPRRFFLFFLFPTDLLHKCEMFVFLRRRSCICVRCSHIYDMCDLLTERDFVPYVCISFLLRTWKWGK